MTKIGIILDRARPGGARAAAHRRLIAGELHAADVRQQAALSLMSEFEDFRIPEPGDDNRPVPDLLLDQASAWRTALTARRSAAEVAK